MNIHVFYKKPLYEQRSTRQPKSKKLSKLQRKNYETLDNYRIKIVSWFNVKLYQNNVNMALL